MVAYGKRTLFAYFQRVMGFGVHSKKTLDTCTQFMLRHVLFMSQRLDETENSNYAGGDTSWEEEKLGSYANR